MLCEQLGSSSEQELLFQVFAFHVVCREEYEKAGYAKQLSKVEAPSSQDARGSDSFRQAGSESMKQQQTSRSNLPMMQV